MSRESDAPTSSALHPALTPLLPFIAVMWEDGAGSPHEVAAVRSTAADVGLPDEALATLRSWTEPSAPPTPTEFTRLVELIRAIDVGDGTGAIPSLSAFGLALWRASESVGPWADASAGDRLDRLEDELGVAGAEAVRRIRGSARPTAGDDPQSILPDSEALEHALAGDHRAIRQQILDLLLRPEMRPPTGLAHPEYRERVLEAVRILADEGIGSLAYPKEFGGAADPGGSLAAFETLAFGDLSVLVKFGVQFGLFGGSIHQLGTERHHAEYLADVASLALPGCYAMTETGHGSNVRDLETLATYDADTGELVVHSPTETSGKDWIGNAACHGQLAVVFARLIVSGEDHGVHAILVPVRDGSGRTLPGVRIEDRGLKLGLNGVDNGRIWFDSVRVPAGNLLDRFASIDDEGRYHSPIPSSGRRFFTMLSTLVAGRVSIAAASVSASKVGLTIAIRYAAERRQFGAAGAVESPILGYTALQRELMPRLATTYGLHFAMRSLQARLEAWSKGAGDDDELETLAAGLKAWATDHCSDTLGACREACGGQGYLAENRFAALKADTDIFTTFEGANLVLHQLAAKGLLSRYRDEMGGLDLPGALRYLGERAETSLTELNPVVTRRTAEEHLLDPDFHLAALHYREARLLRSVATRMRARLGDGVDSFDVVNEVQDHMVTLSRAYAERVILENFLEGVSSPEAAGARDPLALLAALYALSRIEADRGWFLESGYIEPAKSKAIRALVTRLSRDAAATAPSLVAGFGIPEELLPEITRKKNSISIRPSSLHTDGG